MPNLLIIYPHWPPSNLAGVHRARLLANGLVSQGIEVHVLTVDPKYHEEKPDENLNQLVDPAIKVHFVNALNITKPRVIGDIGLRAFFHLYHRVLTLINLCHFDFIWIPIPSFYTPLLGPLIKRKTGVPYGIDYIDPWARDISTRRDWRHKLSSLMAGLLEPLAVKSASLITGVSFEYYRPVLDRNFNNYQWVDPNDKDGSGSQSFGYSDTVNPNHDPAYKTKRDSEKVDDLIPEAKTTNHLKVRKSESPKIIHHTAFPYGYDPKDHRVKLSHITFPWATAGSIKPWVYAGAFLPKSRLFVELLFDAISHLKMEGVWDASIRLYFLGTGSYSGKSITDYALEFGLSDVILEDRARYPYLEVLNFLGAADTVMVIGSTEKHYTASKVFQSLLSKKPVFSVLHQQSSAYEIMQQCQADLYTVGYTNSLNRADLKEEIVQVLIKTCDKKRNWTPDLLSLEEFTVEASAKKLSKAIDMALENIVNEQERV